MSETAEQQDQKSGEVIEAAAEVVAEEAPVEPGIESEAVEPDEEPTEPAPAEIDEEQYGIESKAEATETADDHLRAVLEAVIYVTDEPLSAKQMSEALGQPIEKIEKGLAELTEACAKGDRGLSIREVAGGYKMSTKPEFHEEIRTFVKKLKPPLKLSLAALETLAVIAYKQPITGPEIMEIRGVQGGGVLKTLLDRKLITTSGRKQVVGRPVLYKTTKDFLVQFGLKDLAELPTLKEFEEWSRLALGADEPGGAEPLPAPEAETSVSTETPADLPVDSQEPETKPEPGAQPEAGAQPEPESVAHPEPEPEPKAEPANEAPAVEPEATEPPQETS